MNTMNILVHDRAQKQPLYHQEIQLAWKFHHRNTTFNSLYTGHKMFRIESLTQILMLGPVAAHSQ